MTSRSRGPAGRNAGDGRPGRTWSSGPSAPARDCPPHRPRSWSGPGTPAKPNGTGAVRAASGLHTPITRSGHADDHPVPPRTPGQFRKLDAVAVLTARLLPAPRDRGPACYLVFRSAGAADCLCFPLQDNRSRLPVSRPACGRARSGPLALGSALLSVGSVAGSAQHPAQVNNRLDVDVLTGGRIEEFGLRPESHFKLAGVLLYDRANRLQQRHHGTPVDVMAHGMLEELAQRVAVVVAQVRRF